MALHQHLQAEYRLQRLGTQHLLRAAKGIRGTANQYQPSGYGTLDLNGWWQPTEQVSVNAAMLFT
jgi:hypothetical protein